MWIVGWFGVWVGDDVYVKKKTIALRDKTPYLYVKKCRRGCVCKSWVFALVLGIPYLEITISLLYTFCSCFSRLAVQIPFSGRPTSG